ncbi:MAG TPA: hypothetical protein VF210_21230 [Pseudomonadales bacterium]
MPIQKGMFLLCLLLPIAVAAESPPAVRIELIALDPAEASALPLSTPVYAHIRYQADAPVRLVLRPFRDGQPVEDGVYFSGSPWYPPPEGEGIAWFAFSKPQRIDEIRALATDDWGTEWARAAVERPLTARGGLPKPERAPWVEPMKQRFDRLIREAARSDGWSLSDALLTVFVQLLFLLVPASVALQVVALRKLRGPHLGLAKLSALAMGALWLFVIVTGLAGSNLSPIWLVFLSPLFVALLTVLLLHQRATARGAGA